MRPVEKRTYTRHPYASTMLLIIGPIAIVPIPEPHDARPFAKDKRLEKYWGRITTDGK